MGSVQRTIDHSKAYRVSNATWLHAAEQNCSVQTTSGLWPGRAALKQDLEVRPLLAMHQRIVEQWLQDINEHLVQEFDGFPYYVPY
eukprot:6340618-Amphidinium_carterae.1